MSLASGVTVQDDVLSAFNEFHMTGAAKTDKPKFIILKIAENKKEVVLEDMSPEKNYEVFREKLESARDDKGNPAPRYAVYNVEYELPGEGHRSKIIFISWVPSECSTLWSMLYASTRENLKQALNVTNSMHADDKGDIEWKTVLQEASGGKAGK